LIEKPGATARIALLAALIFLAGACTPHGSRAAGRGGTDATARPHTVLGALIFSPPKDASEVDPSSPILVQTRSSDSHLTQVTVTVDDGSTVDGTLSADGFVASGALQPDRHYTVTATVDLPAGSGSPREVDEQTESLSFATATTPKVVSVSPTVVGPGQAAVVTLNRAAKDVNVTGDASGGLDNAGTTVSLYPNGFQAGAAYDVSMTFTSTAGVAGRPQAIHFVAAGGPSLTGSFNNGDSNLGVAIPVVVGTGQPPADPAAFAARFSITAVVTGTTAVSDTASVTDSATPSPTPSPPPSVPSPGGGGATMALSTCFQYAPPGVTTFGVTPTWLSPTRLSLKPQTPDGYWPPDATIEVHGNLDGMTAQDGASFAGSFDRSFTTGDKRVIDVDLSSQNLVACRNGQVANQFPVSTGVPGKDTHTGTFYIYQRNSDAEMKSSENEFAPDYYDVKHVPWTQYFHNGEALHGAWWHNNFGHPMSHGCVNISTKTRNASWPNAAPNAEYLWSFDNVGDPVVVHGQTPA